MRGARPTFLTWGWAQDYTIQGPNCDNVLNIPTHILPLHEARLSPDSHTAAPRGYSPSPRLQPLSAALSWPHTTAAPTACASESSQIAGGEGRGGERRGDTGCNTGSTGRFYLSPEVLDETTFFCHLPTLNITQGLGMQLHREVYIHSKTGTHLFSCIILLR